MSKLIWIVVGGGLGAGGRYLLSGAEWLKLESGFPMGTFVVNVLGCFIIGLLWQALAQNEVLSPLLIIGFLGGFTTFSSFGLESLQLFEAKKINTLLAYVLLSNIVGLLLVYLGYKLGTVFGVE